MQSFKILGLILLAAVLSLIALVIAGAAPRIHPGVLIDALSPQQVDSFEECVAAGNPVMESYPRQCRSKDGVLFVEDISSDMPANDPNMGFNECAVAGCSGQLCVSAGEAAEIMTTCEYRAEYVCYREAACEKQPSGECGWTPSESLSACLMSPPEMSVTELEVL